MRPRRSRGRREVPGPRAGLLFRAKNELPRRAIRVQDLKGEMSRERVADGLEAIVDLAAVVEKLVVVVIHRDELEDQVLLGQPVKDGGDALERLAAVDVKVVHE